MNDLGRNRISNSDVKVKLDSMGNLSSLSNYSSNASSSSIPIKSPRVRKDFYGNIISKKVKMHKITFADQDENSKKVLVEVKRVKSYRSFYKSHEEEGKFIFKF